ncbi:MAG: Hpt domain-containing protein [Pseudomonadales bacterium]|nr:Hpt domain-containing protein [Pseudomonadales bacterium]
MGQNEHIDHAIMIELQEIMEDDFSVLLETYLVDSQAKLDALDHAFILQDLNKIRDVAHGFKGSSLNMGAHILAGFCASVEDLARALDFDGARKASSKIIEEFEQVKIIIEQKL